MALIAKTDKNILLCVHRDIIIYNPETKSYTVQNVTKIPRKPKEASDSGNHKNDANVNDEDNDGDEEKKAGDDKTFGEINHVAVSPCNRLVAITTSDDKFLFIYQHADAALKLLQEHELNRSSSALRFSPDSKYLLVADKSGDCYIYDHLNASNEEKSTGKWILGHLSIVLDILMTSNGRFIVSSDRDEKIRVTNYPKTQVVETYCLGHSEFVSAIDEISLPPNDNVLISLSGDKTLRLWNHFDGSELVRFDLPAPGLRIARNEQNQIAVVMLDETNISIGIYTASKTANTYDIVKTAKHALSSDVKHVNSVIFLNCTSIWLSCQSDKGEISLKQLELQIRGEKVEIQEIKPIDVVDILQENFSTKCNLLEDVSIWFKKRFDDISEYHERKKRRIEEKNAK